MGLYQVTGLSGAGYHYLGSPGVQVNEIDWVVTSLGHGNVLSGATFAAGWTPLAFLQRVGWVALGFQTPDDPNYSNPLPFVVWDKYISHYAEDYPLSFPAGFVDSVMWVLNTGVVLNLGVFW